MKALLLDLDDTLIDERHAVRQAFSAFIEAHRDCFPDMPEETLLDGWREITMQQWVRFERGEISFLDQRRQRLREFLGAPFTNEEADEAFAPYRSAYQSSLRCFEDVPEFMARTAHLPRIVITNGDRDQQLQKLHATGLTGHVNAVITPMDCGSWKPDPGIFLAAVERLGMEPAHCAMIGDDEIRDIQPARQLGMKAFRVDGNDPECTLLKALENLRL